MKDTALPRIFDVAILRSYLLKTLGIALVFTTACNVLPEMSGGARVHRSNEPSQQPSPAFNSFTIYYDNWLGFRHDQTMTVDSVFARIEAGDRDALKIASKFIDPGVAVISDYGIKLPSPQVIAAPKLRQLQFDTAWSPWQLTSEQSHPAVKALPMQPASPDKIRWQGRLRNAHAEFNSLTPGRFDIHAELEVRIQAYDTGRGEWTYPLLNEHAEGQLTKAMTEDLLKSYYLYFKQNGIDVDSPGFKGFRERKL